MLKISPAWRKRLIWIGSVVVLLAVVLGITAWYKFFRVVPEESFATLEERVKGTVFEAFLQSRKGLFRYDTEELVPGRDAQDYSQQHYHRSNPDQPFSPRRGDLEHLLSSKGLQ